jgi:hypothetical protein
MHYTQTGMRSGPEFCCHPPGWGWSNLGLFFGPVQVCINQAFGLIGMVTGAFPKERKVVERERMGNAYHISAYFLAKVSTATT